MNPKDKTSDSIEAYMDGVAEEEAKHWEQESLKPAHEEWFEQAAADFLAKPEIDPTLAEILEATKQFTRKNFALRSGLLYRQQLQNTPDYETIMELENDLIRLAGEANSLYNEKAIQGPKYTEHLQTEFNKQLIQWAAETLLPKLAGSKVVKVTRSTKKPKSILADCPPAMLSQLGIKYKELLERFINPNDIMVPLANSVAGCNVREWMGQYTGRDTAPEQVLIGTLWTTKERKQWLYGLVEYATELVNLVAHASALDSTIKPRKYLCYFQKKSEATLYRGQEELEALVKNMQADKLLPVYDNERDSAGWDLDTVQDAEYRTEPEPQLNTATQRLRERMAAKRNKQ